MVPLSEREKRFFRLREVLYERLNLFSPQGFPFGEGGGLLLTGGLWTGLVLHCSTGTRGSLRSSRTRWGFPRSSGPHADDADASRP